MSSISRQFGKLTTKSAANESAIAVIISDYEDVDKCLQKIIEATSAWRESWISILTVQLAIVSEYDDLYNPIVGATEAYHGHDHLPTPDQQLQRTQKLRQAYQDLKNEMLGEINMVDARIVSPATTARDYIAPLRKTLKNRENKKLDFERYQDRVLSAHKKMKKTEKDHASLARYEQDLAKAADDFKHADLRLRESFPPLIAAVFSILPQLLAAQILCQNTLLGQYYTILHEYCEEQGFPSPPPPMAEVVSVWKSDFTKAMAEVEALTVIARGKAVHVQMPQLENGRSKSGYMRRPSAQNLGTPRPQPSISSRGSSPGVLPNGRMPRSTSIPAVPPSPDPPKSTPVREPSPPPLSSSYSNLLTPSAYGAPTPQSAYIAHSPAGPNVDYFSRGRQQSETTLSAVATPAAAAFTKKKPPPPPPKKRVGSMPQFNFVTAMYSFDGMSIGDLSFKEGDRIKVVKKTESKDDWWEGELAGKKGSFPANYCE